jgi:hypothetical protein
MHRNTYKHLLEEYEKEPISTKPGLEYRVEVNVEMNDRLSRFSDFAMRVYYDDNENSQFDQFLDEEYIFWDYRNVNNGNTNPGPRDFCNDWEWGQLGWNGNMHWYSFQFDWTPTGNPIKETRMRFMVSYRNPRSKFAQNACQNGEVNVTFGWAYPQYGQTVDQSFRISCPSKVTTPGGENFLLVDELYNGETREPKRGGAAIPFEKPSIDFGNIYDEGVEIRVEAVGPFPDQTSVWIATDANGNEWIDVSPSVINSTSNLEYIDNGNGFRWTSAYTPNYEGNLDGWVIDDAGNPLTNGGFNAYLSGEYAFRICD